MAVSSDDIRTGMEVWSADGQKVGVITGVEGGGTGVENDFEAAAMSEQPDSGGSVDIAGGLGSIPSGTIGDKGRGEPTITEVVTERGDARTAPDTKDTTPGAGGRDAIRGYGMPRDVHEQPATRGVSAEELENLRGVAGPAPSIRAMPAGRPDVILIEDQGTLGIGAGGLRVPFSNVLDIVPGRRIILDCLRDQVAAKFGEGPSLEIDESADLTPF